MDHGISDFLNLVFLMIPILFGVVAVRLGARQVREFHEHTGDTGVIMNVTAMSLFHDDPPPTGDASVADAARSPELPFPPPSQKKKAFATAD